MGLIYAGNTLVELELDRHHVSLQAQVFLAALKASQSLLKVSDHVKNYRPKILVMSGEPRHRPSLVEFANLITKKISLMSTLHIVMDDKMDWKSVESVRSQSQAWLLSKKIKSFHGVTRNSHFSEGVRSALELQGLSKLSPNMILLGFKENWRLELAATEEYYHALHLAMEMKLAVGILRLSHMKEKEPDLKEKEGGEDLKQTDSRSVDSGLELELEAVSDSPNISYEVGGVTSQQEEDSEEELTVVRSKLVQGETIDIYWLYDDGGLTLLVPHILHTRKIYNTCKMRLFFLCSKADQLDSETRAMIALLAKFRIEADDVIIISDATKRPADTTREAFTKLTTLGEDTLIAEEEAAALAEKTNFYLRISEVGLAVIMRLLMTVIMILIMLMMMITRW